MAESVFPVLRVNPLQPLNAGVGGSSPPVATTFIHTFLYFKSLAYFLAHATGYLLAKIHLCPKCAYFVPTLCPTIPTPPCGHQTKDYNPTRLSRLRAGTQQAC